jgi:hypothetical protein
MHNEMQITRNFPYIISTKNVEWFTGYMENSIYGFMHTMHYNGAMWLNIGIASQRLM